MDGTLSVLAACGDPRHLSMSDYNTFVTRKLGVFALTVNKTFALDKSATTGLRAFEAMSAIRTQEVYLCPTFRGLKSPVRGGVPVWAYYFDHIPSCPWEAGIKSDLLELLNATHTADIPFLFGNVGNLPLPSGDCNITTAKHHISNVIVSSWTKMAMHRKPGYHESIAWPLWQNNDSRGLELLANMTSISSIDFLGLRVLGPVGRSYTGR